MHRARDHIDQVWVFGRLKEHLFRDKGQMRRSSTRTLAQIHPSSLDRPGSSFHNLGFGGLLCVNSSTLPSWPRSMKDLKELQHPPCRAKVYSTMDHVKSSKFEIRNTMQCQASTIVWKQTTAHGVDKHTYNFTVHYGVCRYIHIYMSIYIYICVCGITYRNIYNLKYNIITVLVG